MDVYRRLINRDLPWEERACTSKACFVTRDEARSYLRSGALTAGSAMKAYRCRFCRQWHLGHRPRRRGGAAPVAPPPRRQVRREDGGATWITREWWADRSRRHLRPSRTDRAWRDAWAVATA